MLNRSASLAMSTRVLKALPGKLDIKRHSPSILFLTWVHFMKCNGNGDKLIKPRTCRVFCIKKILTHKEAPEVVEQNIQFHNENMEATHKHQKRG